MTTVINESTCVLKEFVSPEICSIISSYIVELETSNSLAPGISLDSEGILVPYPLRLTSRALGLDPHPTLETIKRKIIDKFSSVDLIPTSSGSSGVILTSTLPSGNTFKHIDSIIPPKPHKLSCVLLVSPADSGSSIIIEDTEVPQMVGDLVCFIPTSSTYEITMNIGLVPCYRVIFEFILPYNKWVNPVEGLFI